MSRFAPLSCGFVLALALAAPVSAADGVVRAGADAATTTAPRAEADPASVDEGAPVQVTGCLVDRSWCRVIVGGLPGWMAGEHLVFPLGGRTVTIATHGEALAIPTVDREGVGVPTTTDAPVGVAPPPGG